jgi:hypothetical protein
LYRNPAVFQVPQSMFTETINQSLLATILRWTRYDITERSPYGHPLFVILATLLTAMTVYRMRRFRAIHPAWSFSLLICLGLLIFPKTLAHYSLFLIVPGLTLWSYRDQVMGGRSLVIPVLSMSWLFVWWEQAFCGFAILWLAFAFMHPLQPPTERTIRAAI